MKRLQALVLSVVLALSVSVSVFAQGDELTKAEYAQLLLNEAAKYNPGIKLEDIIKGDNTGGTNDRPVTKAEALVMLKRAFGNLPKTGNDIERTAPDTGDGAYSDVPFWAENDITELANAGVLSEVGELGAGDYIDRDYADTMTGRMYRLYGTNPKDDFYTYVNRRFLSSSTISYGASQTSVFYDMTNDVGEEISNILAEVINTPEDKLDDTQRMIQDFYLSAADLRSRNALGIKPIEKYLKQLDGITTDEELHSFALTLAKDTTLDPLIGFSVTTQLDDKTKYLPKFDYYLPTFSAESYEDENGESVQKLREYIVKVLTLAGDDENTAEHKADVIIDFEYELAKHTRAVEDSAEDLSYNYYTLSQLQKYFKDYDLKSVADIHGFNINDKIVVSDPEQMEFFASYFDGEHTETLKCIAEISMLSFYGDLLTEDFTEAGNLIYEAIYGYNPQNTIYSEAFNTTVSLMDVYLSKIYCDRRLTEEDKEQVQRLTESISSAYKKRIENLDWLSDTTKAEAIKKLDNIKVIIGMSDTVEGESILPDITIYGKGSREDAYLENIYNLLKASDKVIADEINGNIQLGDIYFSAYTVNAMYYPNFNTMVLPAAILGKPMYDSSASLAENYGAIGYIIGHEMSHAFDTVGAKYDENGNYKNWWTDEDYANFERLSKAVEEYYDNAEAATGLKVNGKLTLNENIADLAGLEAALDAYASACDGQTPDYKSFFERYAYIMRCSSTRDVLKSLLSVDTHSPSSVRVNYSVKNSDEFYDAYDVQSGDGMYVAPENRVKIW